MVVVGLMGWLREIVRFSFAASSMYKTCDFEDVNVMTSRSRVRSGLALVS